MTILKKIIIPEDWRNDSTITSKLCYTRKFAYFPKRLSDKTIVWWKHYYFIEKCLYYFNKHSPFRVEKVPTCYISEEEYVFKKLAGTLGN